MGDLASLELRIRLQEANRLEVACQYMQADREEVQTLEGVGGLFSRAEFLELEDDTLAYGRKLADILFADPRLSEFCVTAFKDAVFDGQPVRLRIAIAGSAHALHALHWEKLLHPASDVPLACADYVVFSRLTVQSDWRTTRPRRRDTLRSLICIADDIRSADGGKSPFATFGGASFAEAAKGFLTTSSTVSLGADHDATRTRLRVFLAEGVDVLYAVCHGHIDRRDEPTLVLHDNQGAADYLTATELSQMFRELLVVPRLAVLVSCGSAGQSDSGREANAIHIAPRLAEAGVASVIGFNGNIDIDVAKEFCRGLFEALTKDPDIERAVAKARKTMSNGLWWTPVLLTRLRAGALWYRQGFGNYSSAGVPTTKKDFWTGIVGSVVDGQVTPIVGPDVSMSLLGSRRELALKWALANGYPLVPGGNDSLPQIAQYLSTMYQRTLPINKAIRYAYDQLVRAGATQNPMRYPSLDEARQAIDDIVRAGLEEKWLDTQTLEPYLAIANLKSKVFINLDWTDHLFHALKRIGKEPIAIVPWYWQNEVARAGEKMKQTRTLSWMRKHANTKPSEQQPILYYMFGRLAESEKSLAMSEDDHFDALIELAHDDYMFPSSVKSALCGSNLMFIGCNLQEWNFRVLLRLLVTRAGFSAQNDDFRHVAANIGPEDLDMIDPQRARSYLERYLTNSRIDLYSGTATDFLTDLQAEIARRPAEVA